MKFEFFEAYPAENIGELNEGYRFRYSLFSMVSNNELWVLANATDGTPLMHRDDKNDILVLVWPSLGSAEAFAAAEARQCVARSLTLDKFLNEALPDFTRRGFRIAPAAAPERPFVSCAADTFATQIEQARGLLAALAQLVKRDDIDAAAANLEGTDPRLSFALRATQQGCLWTLRRQWRAVRVADKSNRPLFMIWDSEEGATAAAKTLSSSYLQPEKIDLTDWLYFWTGWLAQNNFRLIFAPDPTAPELPADTAPLVFDRLLRAAFTRLTGKEFPKCY